MIAQISLILACAIFSAQASCYGNEVVATLTGSGATLPFQTTYGGELDTVYGGELGGAYGYGLGATYGSEIGVGLAAPVFAAQAVQPRSILLPAPASSCAFIPTLGPRSPALPVIRTPDVVTPEATKVVDLPAPIAPPTRVVSNTCSCSKKIVKDQVYEQVVRIPSTIRYIKKSYVPVEEKIRYCGNGKVGVEAAAPRSGDVSILPFPFPITRPSCGCN